MFSRWQLAKKYLHYYLTASNGKGHGIHSPFVFDFVIHVLNDRRKFYAYEQVEAMRRQLLNDTTVIEVEDMGAGSALHSHRKRSIHSIAKHAAKPVKWSQLLFRIVQYYQPATILELGTSLGISAAYMASANHTARLVTGEGSPAIAAKARQVFQSLQLNNITLTEGNFDATLPAMLQELAAVDMAFIDGNHRLEPTVRYFEQLLPFIHASSIVILDDIHWSAEMEQAWEQVKQHPAVTLTIDLFFIGLVFFQPAFRSKQHFAVCF